MAGVRLPLVQQGVETTMRMLVDVKGSHYLQATHAARINTRLLSQSIEGVVYEGVVKLRRSFFRAQSKRSILRMSDRHRKKEKKERTWNTGLSSCQAANLSTWKIQRKMGEYENEHLSHSNGGCVPVQRRCRFR
jgi:hypothetical protein